MNMSALLADDMYALCWMVIHRMLSFLLLILSMMTFSHEDLFIHEWKVKQPQSLWRS